MSEKKSPGQLFNEEMLRQQRERNAAIDARNKAAEEKKYNVTFMHYILMDRTLRSFGYEYVIKYLYYIHSSILSFIKKKILK